MSGGTCTILAPVLAHMRVRGGDVRDDGAVGRARHAFAQWHGRAAFRHRRALGQEVRLGEMQRAGRVDRPRAGDVVRVRQADVAALVVGEVQVVAAEAVRQPVGRPDQRRPLDVGADARVQAGVDDQSARPRSRECAPACRTNRFASMRAVGKPHAARAGRAASGASPSPAMACITSRRVGVIRRLPWSVDDGAVGRARHASCSGTGERPSGTGGCSVRKFDSGRCRRSRRGSTTGR